MATTATETPTQAQPTQQVPKNNFAPSPQEIKAPTSGLKQEQGADKGKGVPSVESKTPAQASPAAIEAKKYKLLVDGADVEVDETELIRRAQKATGAEKRFEEANRLRDQLNAILSELKDPKKVFSLLSRPEIGHDIKNLASEWLYENVVKPEQMSTEERIKFERERAMQENEQIKRERDEYKKLIDEEREKRETALEMERLDREMTKTLSQSNLPKTPQTVSRMAYYMKLGHERGVSLTPDDVLPFVRKDFEDSLKALVGGLDGDTLEAFLGSDVSEKIRKHTLAKVAGAQKQVIEKPSTGEDDKPKRRFLSEKDWSAEMNRRLGIV